MTRAALVAVALAASTANAGDGGVDHSQYRDTPPMKWIATVPVTASDDDVALEIKERNVGRHLTGEYVVYFGTDARVDDVEVVKSVPGRDEHVIANIRTWKSPSLARERIRLRYTVDVSFASLQPRDPNAPKPVAATAGAPPKTVPPHVFDTQAIATPYPGLSNELRLRHAGQKLAVMYLVTIGTDGSVIDVKPMTSVPDADAELMPLLKRWRCKPQSIPLRSMVRFVFDIPPAN